MQTPVVDPVQQLAARLLYLQQQAKAIETEIATTKAQCEELYSLHRLATKTDTQVAYSDGSIEKVRLRRQAMGTYFKVGADFKDEYSSDSHRLQARYLKAGKAEMAEKAHTWVAEVVKK